MVKPLTILIFAIFSLILPFDRVFQRHFYIHLLAVSVKTLRVLKCNISSRYQANTIFAQTYKALTREYFLQSTHCTSIVHRRTPYLGYWHHSTAAKTICRCICASRIKYQNAPRRDCYILIWFNELHNYLAFRSTRVGKSEMQSKIIKF